MMKPESNEILSKVDERSTVQLLQKLIQTVTTNPPAEEATLATWVGDYLRKFGLEVEILPFEGKRANVLARIKGSGSKPALIFSAHFDTVPAGENPWKFDPFSATVHDRKVYGRGAADMKGGMAAMLKAAAILSEEKVNLKGDLLLVLTSGETSDCVGAKRLIQEQRIRNVGEMVVSEPTGLNVYVAEKGALWIQASTHGKVAHGSMPAHGENAILKMAKFLVKLESYRIQGSHPLLGTPSISVNLIKGGVAINVIPDKCEIELDIRLLPDQTPEQILETLRQIGGSDVEFKLIDFKKPVVTEISNPFVKTAADAVADVTGHKPRISGVSYYTDGYVLANALKIPMVIIGPAETHMTHQQDEYVEIDRLVDAVKIFILIAMRTLS
jgi:succinyl-diaminopimelate desuccinylase